jgi:predicted HD phosphohydrolase
MIASQEQAATWSLHLQVNVCSTLKMEAAHSSEALVASALLHDVTSQKTAVSRKQLSSGISDVYQYTKSRGKKGKVVPVLY